MEFQKFKKIFDEIIFEKSKPDLLEKISKYPSRYIGLFRPTKPKAKILQNLLQSHEIRFGDAFEALIKEYLKENNFEILPESYSYQGRNFRLDQCFKKDGFVYFVEQKIRDDHDSSKKRGQIENFEKKLNCLLQNFDEKSLKGYFYFIDPGLCKNKNYYSEELVKLSSDYKVPINVLYGEQLFEALGIKQAWGEIINYLEKWKVTIPDLPEINFDINSEETFEEIKDLSPQIFRKLIMDKDIFENITLTLFPERKTLNLLLEFFKTKEQSIYKNLVKTLESL